MANYISENDIEKACVEVLRQELKTEKIKDSSSYVFTLIQKFRSKGKGSTCPQLTDNPDIIVVVD